MIIVALTKDGVRVPLKLDSDKNVNCYEQLKFKLGNKVIMIHKGHYGHPVNTHSFILKQTMKQLKDLYPEMLVSEELRCG